jgi:AcrR family transcriptional regulator
VTSPVITRRRRLEPDERRRQILAAAIELFGEKPYPMVSTIELAERAGVARGLINHYFGNKRELYLEVMRQLVMIAPLTPDQVPQGSVEVRAAAVVDHFLDLISRHGRTWLAAVGAEGVGATPRWSRSWPRPTTGPRTGWSRRWAWTPLTSGCTRWSGCSAA